MVERVARITEPSFDGEIGPQTTDALRRLDRPLFCDAFSRMLTRQYGDDGGDFIGKVMARVP